MFIIHEDEKKYRFGNSGPKFLLLSSFSREKTLKLICIIRWRKTSSYLKVRLILWWMEQFIILSQENLFTLSRKKYIM